MPVLRGWLTKNWLEEISEALIIKSDSIWSSDKGLGWLFWGNLSLETEKKKDSAETFWLWTELGKNTKKFQGKRSQLQQPNTGVVIHLFKLYRQSAGNCVRQLSSDLKKLRAMSHRGSIYDAKSFTWKMREEKESSTCSVSWPIRHTRGQRHTHPQVGSQDGTFQSLMHDSLQQSCLQGPVAPAHHRKVAYSMTPQTYGRLHCDMTCYPARCKGGGVGGRGEGRQRSEWTHRQLWLKLWKSKVFANAQVKSRGSLPDRLCMHATENTGC